MKSLSFRQRALGAAVVLVVFLFAVRPGASRLKSRIIHAISRAVARPSDIGSVHIRLLPRPGFDLENVVIYEDPAFGAEPMLRAPEMIAVVRLTSLLRGRLDISRLELTEPSLNLVRREDGRWNWEALLEHSAQIPLAPTAKLTTELRPGFPYIEASSGRINFKAGAEKKPYALLNADFSLWQDSENTWGLRLRAEPLRGDMNLSDTGLLRIDGTWQRAGSLRETPLLFDLQWRGAQLGQLSKLISGNDQGWRGNVQLQARLSGTPAALQVATDATVRDFHRYDIYASESLGLTAHCDGKYSTVEKIMRELFCTAPVGNGMITLRGDAGVPGTGRLNLMMNAENLPVNSIVQLARRAKKDIPPDLLATGNMQGNFSVTENGISSGGAILDGRGEIAALHLQSTATKTEFAATSVPFVLKSRTGHPARPPASNLFSPPGELRVEYGPFSAPLGRAVPAQVRGWLGQSGYGMWVRGEGEISHTLRMAGLLGLPAARANVEGTVQMDLQIAGTWAKSSKTLSASASPSFSEFPAPVITGAAQLKNARANVRGLNGTIDISSAEIRLSPEQARVEKISARSAKAIWSGSLELPRGCGAPGACLIRFTLNAEDLRLADLHDWLANPAGQRRWYQLLSPGEPDAPLFLRNSRASGKLSMDRLRIRDVVAEQVSAVIDLDHGTVKISDLRADLLGGTHRGNWQADFTTPVPVFTGSGSLTNISLDRLADAMHDAWISGSGDGTYQIKAAGTDSAAFWQAAEGALRFDLRGGELPHIHLLTHEEPLQVSRWQGRATLRAGKIEVEKSGIASRTATYEISGTASLGRDLEFKLVDGNAANPIAYNITGKLDEPRVAVAPAAETQAKLKQ